jgi:membrane-associated protease RseP (regulator of RpoE activity)
LISVNLGVLNLLPIPVLMAATSSASRPCAAVAALRQREMAQQVGLFLLALMVSSSTTTSRVSWRGESPLPFPIA